MSSRGCWCGVMARIRSIKPEFGTNEQLGSISALARLVGALLPCHADSAGRLEDRPTRLKVLILPFDSCSMDSLLNELQKVGFIQRYEVGDKHLIQITNFCKHQRPHPKEPESDLPAPCFSTASREKVSQVDHALRQDPIPDLVPKTEEEAREEIPSPKEWHPTLFWLRDYLEHQDTFNGAQLPRLMDNDWWADLSELTNGIDLPFVAGEFIRMKMWIHDNPRRAPTPKGIRAFLRNWFEKAAERRRKQATYGEGGKNIHAH